LIAGSCLPLTPPLMAANPDVVRAYADLLKRDAETYFFDVERYFRCRELERREVIGQAHEVSEGYARVLEVLDGVRK